MRGYWGGQLRRWMTVALVVAMAVVTMAAQAPGRAAAGTPDFSHSRPQRERQLLSPLPNERPVVPEVHFGVFRPFNEIDHFILHKLEQLKKFKELKVRPKKLCNDWDFARRASLDLVGVIPMVEDLDRYFKWTPRERRGKWIDLLLKQRQYADHWTIFWGDLLRERGRARGVSPNALKNLVHKNLQDNRPFDAWVRELITAEGPTVENPATAFFLQDRGDAETLTVAVSEAFLGVQLKCAQCHDHPFDWWTQRDFQGMASFWRGTRMRVYRTEERETPKGRTRRIPFFEVRTRPDLAAGVFLTGATSQRGRGREGLADLMTRRDNPYFARVAVNRLWEKMTGVGLVNPASNFSTLNPPSHPELLDWLALEFIDSGYDLKHILRLIAESRTYQQTSSEQVKRWAARKRRSKKTPEEDDPIEGALFEGMILRRMTAEQIHDSILVATGRYGAAGRFRSSIEVTYPPGPQSFLRTFGASDRLTIESRAQTGSIQQALTLLNGGFVNRAVRLHAGHPIRTWKSVKGLNTTQQVDALFYQILTRPPTGQERRRALGYLGDGRNRQAWQDLQWALFNTREFQFIR